MNNQHPRYREIAVERCHPDCPQPGENVLNIIVFKKDEKLRHHAVKHLANTLEMDAYKNTVISLPHHRITQQVDNLRDMGCPICSAESIVSANVCTRRVCSCFEACGEVIASLTEEYVQVVEKALETACLLPQYACFFSSGNDARVFYGMPERNMVVKAVLHDNLYNVATCYSKSGFSFGEMRDRQVAKIGEEARSKKDIQWCNPMNWGFRDAEENSYGESYGRPKRNARRKKEKNKVTKSERYRRGGGNARRYLDTFYDE